MTITAIALTNPGAESGFTGWTARVGNPSTSTSYTAHTGTRVFTSSSLSVLTGQFDQQVSIAAYASFIDAGSGALKATGWKRNASSGSSYLYLEIYDASMTLLMSCKTPRNGPTAWTQDVLMINLPVGARTIRIGAWGTGNGTNTNQIWDDFALEISDSPAADYGIDEARGLQSVSYVLGTYPSSYAGVLQAPTLIIEASETSSGLYKVTAHQVMLYALVKKYGDKRKMRAWTFPQDDHKFYVLQLGNSLGTLIYDQLSKKWSVWKSDGEVFWRGEDGRAWEGFNVCCDPLSGKVFKIDAIGRLDYNDTTTADDTPITSKVVGGMTARFRNNIPCYLAELAVSEGKPPSGIDATTVGISLRTGDTLSWYDHGEVPGLETGDKVIVRWYGLGVMSYPGRIFEITDTGYARRIDGLNIDLGDENDGHK